MHNKTINFWVVKNTHLLEEPLCLPDFAHVVIPFELTVAHLDVFNIFFKEFANKKLLNCNGDYTGLINSLQITQGTSWHLFLLDGQTKQKKKELQCDLSQNSDFSGIQVVFPE